MILLEKGVQTKDSSLIQVLKLFFADDIVVKLHSRVRTVLCNDKAQDVTGQSKSIVVCVGLFLIIYILSILVYAELNDNFLCTRS
ncbi:uncharacterized protein STEHIDRAFT_173186, partial [Stereum hirsutum FP-91666 SS1]